MVQAGRSGQEQMSAIGKPERETQNRVIALFRDELGYPLVFSARPVLHG